MSEIVTEDSRESEENPTVIAGSSDEGSSAENTEEGAGASPPDSDHEARLRYWQSKADKAESTARTLEQRLEQLEETSREPSVSQQPDLHEFMEQMELRQEMREVRKELRERYPLARTDVVNGLSKYRSLDDYQFAVEQSHRDVERSIQPEIERREKALREELEGKYGKLNSPPSTGADGVPGRVSVQDLANMSVDEMDAFEANNPGIIDQLLREAE